jgi:uncharacterized membrane protein
MPRAANEVVVDRPVTEVFAFLADAENDERWRRGVIDVKRVSGDGVGTVYAQGLKGPLGRRISADIEITELRPNELIAFRALTGPARPVGRYELSSEGASTRVRMSLDAALGGVKKLLLERPMQKAMNNEVANLAELKRVLERDA